MSIVSENDLQGEELTQVAIQGAGDPTNQGFCREFSGNVGETLTFSCHGTGTVLDIYRIGWYQGLGWRKIDTIVNTATQQPAPVTVPNTNGGVECSNWSVTASWAIPEAATSGLYVGVLRKLGGGDASYIPFVVRNDAEVVDVIIKTSDSTWALAYNTYNTPASPFNGKSVYGSNGTLADITTRAHYGSYLRPIVTRQNVPQTYWLNAEAPLIRYMERNGYNVKYISSKDLDRDPSLLAKGKIFISSGHDEYYSDNMRAAVEAHRDSGKHAIFMSANEVFWRIRFNETRTGMYCYKDTMNGPGSHTGGAPLDPVSWTGTWKDTRWSGRKPENTLTGTDFRMNGVNQRTPTVSTTAPFINHPVWRNADLSSPVTFQNIVGFEADLVKPERRTPHSSILMSQDFPLVGIYANDNGQNYDGDGLLNWGVVSQRYASGSVVVGFGTCQWAWCLDSTHDRAVSPVVPQGQQFTMNLLRDLGAVPATPMSGMTLSEPVSLDAYGTTGETSNGVRGRNGVEYEVLSLVNGELISSEIKYLQA